MHTILFISALAIWIDFTAIALGRRTPLFWLMMTGIIVWAWLSAHFLASQASDQAEEIGDQAEDLAA